MGQINWVTLFGGIMAAAKLILQSVGISIPDQNVNEIVNGIAALATVITIIMSHRRKDQSGILPMSKNYGPDSFK